MTFRSIEVDLYRTLNTVGKTLRFISIVAVLTSFIAIIASVIIVLVGKDKDKIVFLDTSGRPYLIRQDNPDRIYAPELEYYIRDVVPLVLEWDFAEIKSEQATHEHLSKIFPYFDAKFFNSFLSPLQNIYLKSILEQRAIIKTHIDNVYIAKIKGKKSAVVVDVRVRTIKAGVQGAEGEASSSKKYVIKVYKGGRSIANPYGLYITYFSEYSPDALHID